MVFDLTLRGAPALPNNDDTIVVDDNAMAMTLMNFMMMQLTLAGDQEIHLDLSCIVWLPLIFIAIASPLIRLFADRVVKLTLTKTTTTLTA